MCEKAGDASSSHLVERDRIHTYWARPDDGANKPESYVQEGVEKLAQRSEALVEIVRRYADVGHRILEVGCNAGRNLSYLQRAGYSDLSGIEISADALAVMKDRLPTTYEAADIRLGPVEEVIQAFPPMAFDLVFTMAVLIHIHPDSEAVIEAIAERAARCFIAVEHEGDIGHWRHFQRRYRPLFEAYGFRQVEKLQPFPGLPRGYIGRVFLRT